MVDLTDLGIPALCGIFVAAVAAVWFAGIRLSRLAGTLSDRFSLGEAFTGMLLLAGATSLPEVATTVSASSLDSASLAVSNLMGGVAMQTAVLAVVDLIAVRGALTYFTPKTTLIAQGVMLVTLLALVIAAIAVGEPVSVAGVGIWSACIFTFYLVSVYILKRSEGSEAWEPINPPAQREDRDRVRENLRKSFETTSTTRVVMDFCGMAAIVALAGWFVAVSADAIADRTGIERSIVGATFVAISTSLPELTTTYAAVHLGAHSMAVSNILGSNCIDVSLVFVADLTYRKGPVLQDVGSPHIFAAALGIVLTSVYLWGLIERRDRTVLRMGIDSAIVLVLYAIGIAMLVFIR